jgi:hypothetical protein
MDHLPSVPEPYQPIEVPYLGGKKYDGLGFSGYPARQRWQVDVLLEGDLQGRTPTEAAQFLQTWLYFGMVREALAFNESDQISGDDFIRVNDSGQGIISTRKLPELLTALVGKARVSKWRNEHTAYFERFRKCMALSCAVWRTLVKEDSDGTAQRLLSPEILLSIQVLGATLDIGITEVCKTSPDNFHYTWRVIPRSNFLMKRMVSQGWCPSVVEQLSKPCMTFLYYVSLLGPPGPVDHSHCSAEARSCSAKNVNAGNYKLKHVSMNCKCDHIFIPTGDGSKVANAIRDGHIPVIHLRDNGLKFLVDIDIHSPWNPIAYTAISHV